METTIQMPHRYLGFFAYMKINVWLISSAVTTAIIALFEKYIFNDWQFLVFLSVMICVDTILGLARAWQDHAISVKGFGHVIIKLIIYGAALVFTHALAHFTVEGVRSGLFNWFTAAAYSCLMVKEAMSIMILCNRIKPGFFPGWLMKRFADFDEKGMPLNNKQ